MDWNSRIISGFRAGIVAIDRDGVVGYINPIGTRILEGSPLAVGDNIRDKAGENPFFWMLSEAISLDYLSPRVETYLTDRRGEPMRIGFTLAALDDGIRKTGICAFFKDLRHVEMAEESENLRQRLLLVERIGAALVGEIADPIVNLGVVCEMLRSEAARENVSLTALRTLETEVAKLESIVRECQGFVQPVTPSLQVVAIDAIVEDVVARLSAAHKGMGFRVSKPDGVDLSALADPRLLADALSTLVLRAVELRDGRGGLEIAISRSGHFIDLVRLDREVRCLLPGHTGREAEYVRIAIRGEGGAAPRDVRERVFIPFDPARNSRAELAVAQKVVSALGGIIECRETAGKEAEFRVMIPAGRTGAAV